MESRLLDWKSIGSILATFMFLRTALRDFLPPELQHFLSRLFRRFLAAVNPRVSILIDEYDPSSYTNELFDAAHSYIGEKCRLVHSSDGSAAAAAKPSSYLSSATITTPSAAPGAIHVRWSFRSVERVSSSRGGAGIFYGRSNRDEHRYYEISFHRRHQAYVQDKYIPFVVEEASRIRFKNRERRLYTNRSAAEDGGSGRHWSSVPFHHPSTFDTLAIDPQLKEEIQGDLRRFINRRDYYVRVGRAWKRGYLLYGPPGTGKTSLIAAIANFLEFDIYDLELTAVTSNSQLRKLLVSTSSKSVVVIEDEEARRRSDILGSSRRRSHPNEEDKKRSAAACYSTVSLSGVLNFVDGLWSSCVGERLMIFTTNHVEKLDPALLRPGRMDKRINLSYCGVAAFKMLARNYLGVDDNHRLMGEAAQLVAEVNITPAEIAEAFMGCEDDAQEGMRKVVEEMRRRWEQLPLRDDDADRDKEVNAKIVENGVCSEASDDDY
ncbi:unnamed protein product [Spirodela intermedia]|uniref:AAA+ ATPase domain-containing protein n=1 Tax=Spirodela intermedia TaxID=51605 RepID=A0A7I8JLV9_SPIIN|nr:unnamed protein product [Spirodela intermedia]CAA6671119.1 unnamed protein product [Spirodela intermedia]